MRVKQEVIEVLKNARIEENLLYIDMKLDSKLYADVNKILKGIGGKWSSAKRATVFQSDPTGAIEEIISSGDFTSEKKIFQFYPTPDNLAKQVVSMAGIQDGDVCLEPSAGRGNIAKYMPGCDCVELNPDNRKYLQDNGFNLIHDDFLTFAPKKEYDIIVMNPPFTKGQDIAHVSKAIDLAKKRVVAIVSATATMGSDKAHTAFLNLLSKFPHSITELPKGAFKESGTMVNTVIIVIDKTFES
ncbi:MAG: hypothetical protein ACI3ZQ_05065 [Candidatus Cryptobacteroides sp.]